MVNMELKPQIKQVCSIKEEGFTLFQCMDCSGTGKSRNTVLHFKNCKPGKAAFWMEYYKNENKSISDFIRDKITLQEEETF